MKNAAYNFNIGRLRWYCGATTNQIMKKSGGTVVDNGWQRRHAFINNGGDVLAVAHLDVSPTITEFRKRFNYSEYTIYSPSLDDRLGAYIICDMLPKLGLKYDILLTEGEELGMSTAADFDPAAYGKSYNWIFEFDRHGGDVVMYQYHDIETKELLEDHGFKVGRGSFTDICDMEHLGVKAFNFGTGYKFEHSKRCFANLRLTAGMIDRFIHFFNALSETRLEHTVIESYYRDWYDMGDFPKGWQRYAKGWEPLRPLGSARQNGRDHDYWTEEDKVWDTYETTRQQMLDVYGAELDDLTWADYCELMGLDPNVPLHAMRDEDWRIWEAMGLR